MYVCLQKPANKLKVHANGDIYTDLKLDAYTYTTVKACLGLSR